MHRLLLLLFLLSLGINTVISQKPGELNIDQLLHRIQSNKDTTYVINFWATWCKPCVAELHIFESQELQQSAKPLKVLLVSLDFKSQVDKQLIPFLEKRQIGQEVLLLNEKNPNEWIDKIDSSWSGAIPATVIYNGNSKVFHEGELSLSELQQLIKSTHQ
ncbi:MAG: TlpA family protein disulfide reductase [Carboxylicivirga sp.]|jgi:thiol-disulfide isomerase/thioredoxin|nr:TlpA family protein disulfide reductase [Carboxylicivirga sp.]